jgi:hypothetical protein
VVCVFQLKLCAIPRAVCRLVVLQCMGNFNYQLVFRHSDSPNLVVIINCVLVILYTSTIWCSVLTINHIDEQADYRNTEV